MSQTSDLSIDQISDALHGKKIDVIVSGSIGAIEAPRLLRALRRLGADVTAWLTKGGAQFCTPTSLEWASGKPIRTDFSGHQSHLAEGDACVVSPASANFLRKLAQGITDSPSSALAASYSGFRRPLIVLPNMHDSLMHAPAVQENLAKVSAYAHLVPARREEGKQKFPEPAYFADEIAHRVNQKKDGVTVAFGSTRAYLDDVRYLSNYSSGALGSTICEELYRQGFRVHAVMGPTKVEPRVYSALHHVETNQELEDRTLEALNASSTALIFLASVLDYAPTSRASGKLRSGKQDLTLNLAPTKKILPLLKPASGIKIGFKLESQTDDRSPEAIAKEYLRDYGLSALVWNYLSEINMKDHRALFYTLTSGGTLNGEQLESKSAIAARLARFMKEQLR